MHGGESQVHSRDVFRCALKEEAQQPGRQDAYCWLWDLGMNEATNVGWLLDGCDRTIVLQVQRNLQKPY